MGEGGGGRAEAEGGSLQVRMGRGWAADGRRTGIGQRVDECEGVFRPSHEL